MRRFIMALAAAVVFTGGQAYAAEIKYDASYKDNIFKMVLPTYTIATVNEDCLLRTGPGYISAIASELKKGAAVEVLQDFSEKWYKVANGDEDAVGWMPGRFLDIHEEQTPKLPDMNREELEAFANIMNFPTSSGYFIWTDIARQKTHVFKKSESYSLVNSFTCSTGKCSSPTTRGFFFIKGRGEWFYSSRLKSGGMYWVRFNGTYLFHSLPMDKNKRITDNTLGERRSSGCVRFALSDAKWLYENMPDGTSVFIH